MMTIPLLYFVFSFLTYEVSYSEKMKIFRRNMKFISEIFGQNHKNKFRNNLFRNNL